MTEESETLQLHVSVGDVTIKTEGPVDEAETWFEALREDYLSDIDAATIEAAATTTNHTSPAQGSSTETANNSSPSATTREKSLSLTEYYKQADNPSKRDSALLVGWYLEFHDGQENFTRTEIENKAEDARINLGANVSRDLSKQVEDGRIQKIDERDGHDVFHLTVTGEDYISDELSIDDS